VAIDSAVPVKRTEKNVLIVVKKYFVNGRHTCANDFDANDGGVCQFLRVTNWGEKKVCSELNNMQIFRADEGEGMLLPIKGCPIKKAKIMSSPYRK